MSRIVSLSICLLLLAVSSPADECLPPHTQLASSGIVSAPNLKPPEAQDWDSGLLACVAGHGDCTSRSLSSTTNPSGLLLGGFIVPASSTPNRGGFAFAAFRPGTIATSEQQCPKHALTPRPEMVRSGIWMEDRKTLLILANSSGAILYQNGGVHTNVAALYPDLAGLSERVWAGVARFGDGYLARIGPAEAVLLDRELRPTSDILNLRTPQAGARYSLNSLYSCWTLSQQLLIGYGALDSADGRALGIVSGQLEATSPFLRNVRLLHPLEQNSYYLLGFDYVGHNDLGAFYMLLDGVARLYWLPNSGLDPVEIDAVPERVRELPPITASTHSKTEGGGVDLAGTFLQAWARVEASALPVGVYGDGKDIVLLTRWPTSDFRGTEWRFYIIDPTSKATRGWVRLPTNAANLSIIPSESTWTIIEKGPRKSLREEEVLNVLMIPRSVVRAALRSGDSLLTTRIACGK